MGAPGASVQRSGREPTRLVIRFPGELRLAQARVLTDRLRALPVHGGRTELHLPDADFLPAPCLAACVLLARRIRAAGGEVRIVAGPGVARSVARAGLCWLLPVCGGRDGC